MFTLDQLIPNIVLIGALVVLCVLAWQWFWLRMGERAERIAQEEVKKLKVKIIKLRKQNVWLRIKIQLQNGQK